MTDDRWSVPVALSGLLVVMATGCVRSGFAEFPETTAPPSLVGDVDHDGCVGCSDLEIMSAEWGQSGPGLRADFNGDGEVNFADLGLISSQWGKGCAVTPTWSLTLQVAGLDAQQGRLLRGILLAPDDTVVATFSRRISAGGDEIFIAEGLIYQQRYPLYLFLDLDGDQRCGVGDMAWILWPSPSYCDAELTLNATTELSAEGCDYFDPAGDLDAGLPDRMVADVPRDSDAGGPDAASAEPWFSCDHGYRLPIVIDHTRVAADLTEFPILLKFADGDLAEHAQPSGVDLVFVRAGNVIPHELGRFDSTSGDLGAWVKLPRLSSTQDTALELYFGSSDSAVINDPRLVWSNGFAAVFHFTELPATAGSIRDSTANENHGMPSAGMEDSTYGSCFFSPCLSFDGVDDWIRIENTLSLRLDDVITVQAWFKARSITDTMYLVAKTGQVTARGWDLSFAGNSPDPFQSAFRFSIDGDNSIYATSWADLVPDRFYAVAGVLEVGAPVRFFLDGQLDFEQATPTLSPLFDPDLPIVIGNRADLSGDPFNGAIEEVRISSVARSAEWLATEHANLTQPGLFHRVGSVELQPNPCPSTP